MCSVDQQYWSLQCWCDKDNTHRENVCAVIRQLSRNVSTVELSLDQCEEDYCELGKHCRLQSPAPLKASFQLASFESFWAMLCPVSSFWFYNNELILNTSLQPWLGGWGEFRRAKDNRHASTVLPLTSRLACEHESIRWIQFSFLFYWIS